MSKIIQYMNSYHGRSPDILHEIEQNNVTGDIMYPCLGADAGRFLYTYIIANRPKTILELGTGCGYATIWIARAAIAYGGKITTVEHSEQMINIARHYVTKAGLSCTVTFELADAQEWVARSNKKVDLILQDTYPQLYCEMLTNCIKLLRPGKALITHDALLKARNAPQEMINEMEIFSQELVNHSGLYSTVIPVDDGLWLSIKV